MRLRLRPLPTLLWVLSIAVTAGFCWTSLHGLRAPIRNDAEAVVLEFATRMTHREELYPEAAPDAYPPVGVETQAEEPAPVEAYPIESTPVVSAVVDSLPAAAPAEQDTSLWAMFPEFNPAPLNPPGEEAKSSLPSDPSWSAIMPGVPALVAAFAGPLGAATWQPRVIAWLLTLITAFLIGWSVRAETNNDTIGVAAAGVFLAARLLASDPGAAVVESCAMCLLAAAFYALRFARGALGTAATALALSAALFTHPMAAWFVVAALAHALMEQPRRGLALASLMAGMIAITTLLLAGTLGPGMAPGVWNAVLAAGQLRLERALDLVGTQLLGRLGVMTLVSVLTFALPVRPWRGAVGAWTWMAMAGLAASLSLSQSSTSWAQAWLPALVTLAIVGPISLQRVTRHLSAWPGADRLGGQGVVLAGLALQLVALISAVPAMMQSR